MAPGRYGGIVFLGDGSGNFVKTHFTLNIGDRAAVTVGDFNGNGKLDAAALNYNAQSVTIWLNYGQWFWTTKD